METEYEICVFNNNNTPKTSFHKYNNIFDLKKSIWHTCFFENNQLKNTSFSHDYFLISIRKTFNYDSQNHIDICYSKYQF
jgi:hypothetical protein